MIYTINVPGLAAVAIIILIVILFIVITLNKRKAVLKEFCKKNGFNYVGGSSYDLPEIESEYLNIPPQQHNRKFSDLVTGTIDGKAFRLFKFFSQTPRRVGVGSSAGEAILEVEHSFSCPSFFIYRTLLKQHYDYLMPHGYVRLPIEGDFNKYLDIFIPADSQVEVLAFLTPDKLQVFLDCINRHTGISDYGQHVNGFEFTLHKFYIYRFVFDKQEHLQESLHTAGLLLTSFK